MKFISRNPLAHYLADYKEPLATAGVFVLFVFSGATLLSRTPTPPCDFACFKNSAERWREATADYDAKMEALSDKRWDNMALADLKSDVQRSAREKLQAAVQDFLQSTQNYCATNSDIDTCGTPLKQQLKDESDELARDADEDKWRNEKKRRSAERLISHQRLSPI